MDQIIQTQSNSYMQHFVSFTLCSFLVLNFFEKDCLGSQNVRLTGIIRHHVEIPELPVKELTWVLEATHLC